MIKHFKHVKIGEKFIYGINVFQKTDYNLAVEFNTFKSYADCRKLFLNNNEYVVAICNEVKYSDIKVGETFLMIVIESDGRSTEILFKKISQHNTISITDGKLHCFDKDALFFRIV